MKKTISTIYSYVLKGVELKFTLTTEQEKENFLQILQLAIKDLQEELAHF